MPIIEQRIIKTTAFHVVIPKNSDTNTDSFSSSIGVNDVLLGCSSVMDHHEGNRRFFELVKDYQQLYSQAKKLDKHNVSKHIVAIIVNRGGRFLVQQEDYIWEEVTSERACKETSQALHEETSQALHEKTSQVLREETSQALYESLAKKQQQLEALQQPQPQGTKMPVDDERIIKMSASYVVIPNSNNTDLFSSSIGPNDVLLYCRGLMNHILGNRRFLELVKDYQQLYSQAKVLDRSKVSKQIVSIVVNRGGRFLMKQKGEENIWEEVTFEVAHKKTSQALRESLEEKRRRLP
jgi:hypothetical protein